MTKNTPQNKAAFFAQYVNQPVYVMDGSNVVRLLRPTRVIAGPGDYLSLKSLSEISDEDAIEVARMFYMKPNGKYSPDWCRKNMNHLSELRITADYLRSKSYLLPFRDITVEEILSFGWARINNDKTNE